MRRAPLAALVLLLLALPGTATAAVRLADVGTFTRPVYVTAPPGDLERVFVVQQTGEVRVVDKGVVQAAPYLDLGDLVTDISPNPDDYSERGLLGLAFAPDFATSGRSYVFYTARGSGNVRVDEVRNADMATRRTILEVPHGQQGNHNGGQLAFGPDGKLYAGVGDGGSGDDPAGNGQNLTSSTPPVVNGVDHHPHLGKILRLDPAAGTSEIWSWGLRNPYRFSFDRQTGDLTIGDVGQNAWEEIDFAPAPDAGKGWNFGWRNYEATHLRGGETALPDHRGPVLEHAHSSANRGFCSITGGYVVRDPALPDLAGQYVYGDYCGGVVRAARLSASGATGDRDLGLEPVGHISGFGEDGCGRVYVTSLDGRVVRLADSGQCVVPGPSAPGGGPGSPGAPGGPGTPGADTAAPAVTLRAAARQRPWRTGLVRVVASCDEQCDVSAAGTFLVRRSAVAAAPLRAASVRRTLAGGARVSLALRVSARTRRSLLRSLRRGRSVTVRFTVTARDGAGNTRTRTERARVVLR